MGCLPTKHRVHVHGDVIKKDYDEMDKNVALNLAL